MDNLFIVSSSILIEKQWRSSFDRKYIENLVVSTTPGMTWKDSILLLSIPSDGLAFVTVSKKELDPLAASVFMRTIIQLLTLYFGPLSESIIKDNFLLIYELLEEVVDHGHAYITEACILKELIPPPTLLNSVMNAVSIGTSFGVKQPSGALSTVPWRENGLKYTSNEIFFDVVEEWQAVLNDNSLVIAGCIFGKIEANCRLSGMPDCVLQFQNRRALDSDSIGLHPCVRYNRFEREGCLSFVPPDGKFTLMDYTLELAGSDLIRPPIHIKPHLTFRPNQVKMDWSIESRAGNDILEAIELTIQFESSVSNLGTIQVNIGTSVFDASQKTLRWTIDSLSSSGRSVSVGILSCAVYCNDKQVIKTATCSFKSTTSVLKIGSLVIQNEAYTPFKGLKCKSIGSLDIEI